MSILAAPTPTPSIAPIQRGAASTPNCRGSLRTPVSSSGDPATTRQDRLHGEAVGRRCRLPRPRRLLVAAVVAACFGVIFTQLGFLGHDAGHRQILASRSANYVLGVVFANLMVGLSYGWWVDKHNRHHAHPNDAAKDPDVGAGALVFTTGQAGAAAA